MIEIINQPMGCKQYVRVTNEAIYFPVRFPHNYVGSTFKPLPGIHELAAKLQKRREQQEGYEAATGAGKSMFCTKEKQNGENNIRRAQKDDEISAYLLNGSRLSLIL